MVSAYESRFVRRLATIAANAIVFRLRLNVRIDVVPKFEDRGGLPPEKRSIRKCDGLEGEPVPIEWRGKPSTLRIAKRGFLGVSGGHDGRSERPKRWHG